MFIFDLFTFKKEAVKIFSRENLSNILSVARSSIIEQVKAKISGAEKKFIVDEKVIAKIKTLQDSCKNKVLVWLLEQLIILVPTITQHIYDCLKEKVENL